MGNIEQSQVLHFEEVNGIELKPFIQNLPTQGKIKVKNGNYCYLDIDDRYIHNNFDVLQLTGLKKPDYFDKTTDFIGAHISIFYPEENIIVNINEIGKTHAFMIEGLFSVNALGKQYYVLKVIAPTLLGLRKKYGLTDKLSLKKYLVDLHITVGELCLI